MGFHWIHLDAVDANLPLTEHQRREVKNRAYVLGRARWGFIVKMAAACLALPVAVAVCGYVLTAWLSPFLRINVAAPIGFLSALGVCVFVFSRLILSWHQRPIRMALREMGYDVCLGCGYWLRGLDVEVKKCPECGAAREAMAPSAEEASP